MLRYAYEWFLLEIDAYIAVLNEWRRRTFHAFTTISISLARLFLLLLKRTVCIVKNWFKENKIDEWLKTVLHGMYLTVFEDLYIFLYVLHFFRAFLTLIKYFIEQDNKNLVEVTKLLYALFKVFISVLMLILMLLLIAHGMAPLATMSYQAIKILFRIYTFSKFAISVITLGFSYYQLKTCNKGPDHDWLRANYQSNVKKHFEILVVTIPMTVLLTLVSFGVVAGPWLWILLGLATLFLVFDMAKAIYYHLNKCAIPEPEVATLTQQNSFINVSMKDYYYRKCRSGRLEIDNIENNRIYLLKEIVVKIMELRTKFTHHSASRFGFFSETAKLQKKIEGLKQMASHLLMDDYKENERLRDELVKALKKDYLNFIATKNVQGLIYQEQIENLINEFNDHSSNENIFDELLYARDRIKKKFNQKDMTYSQSFKQSFFKSKGDCEDILDACELFKELQQKANEIAAMHQTNVENPGRILA